MSGQIAGLCLWSAMSLGLAAHAASETPIASSGQGRVHLVELYSSESCSSCPPADVCVGSLQNKSGLWKRFVPVVFHVDYWNHLGWKDGYSSDVMTQRQVNLSKLWPEPAVYTPAFVVDGKEFRQWHGCDGLWPDTPSLNLELDIFKNADGSFRVKASGLNPAKHYRVRAATLGLNVITDVKGGENSGRTLKHNFIVLAWDGKIVSAQVPEQTFSFKIEKQKGVRLAIAAWIEEDGNPTPLQSVGGYL